MDITVGLLPRDVAVVQRTLGDGDRQQCSLFVHSSRTDLPTPENDRAADHLPGARLPVVELQASDGRWIGLDSLVARSVVFVYPGIGGPGDEDLLEKWMALPGASGCTLEACGFRDGFGELQAEGVQVFGLSSQSNACQREHVREHGLPYPLLSDPSFRLRETLGLPTFQFHGTCYFKRLTMIIAEMMIEAALYPVFPPREAATQALGWLHQHPRGATA
jgi:peroxiredoxin